MALRLRCLGPVRTPLATAHPPAQIQPWTAHPEPSAQTESVCLSQATVDLFVCLRLSHTLETSHFYEVGMKRLEGRLAGSLRVERELQAKRVRWEPGFRPPQNNTSFHPLYATDREVPLRNVFPHSPLRHHVQLDDPTASQ